jgi:calcineurin-like phosphoesterase family protein
MRRWITADWHIGEERMAIMQRPFKDQREMIETLVARHNAVVAPEDIVFNLGDVCNQKTPEFLPEVARFNGTKILVRGNHDRVFTDAELTKYFPQVYHEGLGIELQVGDVMCYLTHYPSRAKPDLFNLVGHIHSAWKFQLNMVNVGVDVNHFVPHNLDVAVPFWLKAISDFYDDDVWAAYLSQNKDYIGKRGKKGVYFPATVDLPSSQVK